MAAAVFKTPHSTDWHRAIAEQGTILLSEVGSTMHGVTVAAADDIDEMGVCIPPPEAALGVKASTSHLFEQYEFRTQPVGARSGPGDIDRTIYSLRKYARLAGQGNPTVLMILFSPPDMLRINNDLGQDLRRSRAMFVSKQCGLRFEGYLKRQRARVTDASSQHANRPELVAQYGFDTKFAYHALRLAMQGIELMQDGAITLPMPQDARSYLLDVRTGKYEKADVLAHLDALTADLQRATDEADLPEHADFSYISSFVARMHLRAWESRQEVNWP
ncbi:DNA polymerase beta superfamily protein [Mycobacterium sp.]|uniref:DNA polymerase beta superfamily protein n=1 Tax=Mycobacterium sp. TaxID=1785 RepID=UPI002DB0AB4B|nr:nucleotidyltransferase domain-containing protein [Mycobacterium sp.]